LSEFSKLHPHHPFPEFGRIIDPPLPLLSMSEGDKPAASKTGSPDPGNVEKHSFPLDEDSVIALVAAALPEGEKLR